MFRVVMPSAQNDVPLVERRTRFFLADGTEIFGVISYAVRGGPPSAGWPVDNERVWLEFSRDAFVVES